MNEVKKNFSKWMYYFLLALAIIIVYKFLDNFTAIGQAIGKFFDVIAPFLTGGLLAYLLYIPASRIEKGFEKSKRKFIKKKARGISVLITYIIAILIIILLVNVILPVVIDSVIELVSNIQNYWNIVMEKWGALPEDSILKSQQAQDIIKALGESIQGTDYKQYISTERITGYIKSVIGVASGIFDIFVAIIVSVYILLQRGQIMRFFRRLSTAIFDEKICNKMEEYINSTNNIFYKFISGQLIDAVVVGIMVTIAMSIIGVKYAVLLGLDCCRNININSYVFIRSKICSIIRLLYRIA